MFTSHQFLASPAELDNISPDDPRLSPGYYAYYYSQRRLDPRLPPPLVVPWSGYSHFEDDDNVESGYTAEANDDELAAKAQTRD